MKPTQAQIEAAAYAMFNLEYRSLGSNWVIPKWDESHRNYWAPLASAALTAAAQVGIPEREHILQKPGQKPGKWDARYSGSAKEIEDHTIERCAQVAENHPDKTITCNRIAAAIRALKEKP